MFRGEGMMFVSKDIGNKIFSFTVVWYGQYYHFTAVT